MRRASAEPYNRSVAQQHSALAQACNGGHVVGDDQNGSAVPADIFHFAEAAPLKGGVSDREDFVDNEDFRL